MKKKQYSMNAGRAFSNFCIYLGIKKKLFYLLIITGQRANHFVRTGPGYLFILLHPGYDKRRTFHDKTLYSVGTVP